MLVVFGYLGIVFKTMTATMYGLYNSNNRSFYRAFYLLVTGDRTASVTRDGDSDGDGGN